MEHLISKYFNEEVGQIIYVGVGHSSLLDFILSLEYKSLQLIEPIESIATKLERKFASDKVSVKNIAISPVGGIANFTIMQPAKYSSLKQNITLEHVLKNSAVTSVEAIQTISLSDLVKQSELNKNENNVLILSVNGSEFDCLASVSMVELTLFSTLFIQIENQGIYSEDIEGEAKLKTLLRSHGFYFENMQQEGAIFTNLVFKKDDTMLNCLEGEQQLDKQLTQVKEEKKLEKAKLAACLSVLETDYSKLQSENKRLIEQNSEVELERNNLVSQLDSEKHQSEEQKQEFTQKVEQLDKQLAQVKQNKEAEKTELVNRNSQLDTQLRALQSKQDELVKSHSNKDTQINTLTEQRDKEAEYHQKNKQWAESLKIEKEGLESQNSDLVARDAQLEASYSQLETNLTEQLSKAKNNLEERQRHSDLTQKLYAKAQIDLDHLRQQYQQKYNSEQQLVGLIKELRSKLQHATNFYHLLENEHPELLTIEARQYSDKTLNTKENQATSITNQDDIVITEDTLLNTTSVENQNKSNHQYNKKNKKKLGGKRNGGSKK